MDLPELDEFAFRNISEHLKAGGTYGLKKDELTRQTLARPYLYHLLMKFALVNVHIPFTTIKVNGKPPKGCKEYYVVGFGNYTGGELRIANSNYDIWRRPRIVREVAEHLPVITGKRMTLTFYALETSRSLGEFEPVVVGDEWVIRQSRQFQPPLYLKPEKRLKAIKEDTEDEEDIPSDAVEFLRGIIQKREAQGAVP
jgi:hypothetical protein